MEPQEYDEIIRHLVRVAMHQETVNTDLRACIVDLREFARQQVEMNQHLAVTQARIEALLARMISQGETGRDA